MRICPLDADHLLHELDMARARARTDAAMRRLKEASPTAFDERWAELKAAEDAEDALVKARARTR
jgi:hypothetical protein